MSYFQDQQILYEHERLLQASGDFGPSFEGIFSSFQQTKLHDAVPFPLAIPPSGEGAPRRSTSPSTPANNFVNIFSGGGVNVDGPDVFIGPGGSSTAGPPGATGPQGPQGPPGAAGSGAFWEDGLGTRIDGDGTSSDSAYSIRIDNEVASELIVPVIASLESLELAGGGLQLKCGVKNLTFKFNDGNAVISVTAPSGSDATVSIDTQVQSCPDPC